MVLRCYRWSVLFRVRVARRAVRFAVCPSAKDSRVDRAHDAYKGGSSCRARPPEGRERTAADFANPTPASAIAHTVRSIKVPKRRGYCDLKAQRSSRGRRLPLARTGKVSAPRARQGPKSPASPSGQREAARARASTERHTLDAAAARHCREARQPLHRRENNTSVTRRSP